MVDQSLADGVAQEMIVVMPNAYTRYQGSMYSNSVTTGDWEAYVARELVAYIDGHYRTLANVASHGLAGHSMGGYGTMRIGMKYPDVFSSIYALSPCCMIPNLSGQQGRGGLSGIQPPRAESIHTQEEFEQADFGTKAQFASAAAWSPNPKNPPLFFDLPTKDGQVRNGIMVKWAANAPLAMVDRYIENLRCSRRSRSMRETKTPPSPRRSGPLDEMLNGYDLPHTFGIYEGTHTSAINKK